MIGIWFLPYPLGIQASSVKGTGFLSRREIREVECPKKFLLRETKQFQQSYFNIPTKSTT